MRRRAALAPLLILLVAVPASAEDRIGMLPLRSSVPGLAEADLQLGRGVAEAGQRGAVGPAELEARLARSPAVSSALAQARDLLRQAEEARFHMDRALALAAAERARARLGPALARFAAPELLAEAWVAIALGELLKPAAPDRAEAAFGEALAIEPALRPDPTRLGPSAGRLLERARSRVRPPRAPTSDELSRLAELTGLPLLVWTATEPVSPSSVRLSLVIYDQQRRAVVFRVDETLETGGDALRALSGRIAGALGQVGSAAPRAPAPVASTPPASKRTAPGKRASKPWYRLWWVWALTGVVVGGVVTVLAVELSNRHQTVAPPTPGTFDIHLHF